MSLLDKGTEALAPSTTEWEVNAIDVSNVDAFLKEYQMLVDGDGDAGDRRT